MANLVSGKILVARKDVEETEVEKATVQKAQAEKVTEVRTTLASPETGVEQVMQVDGTTKTC